MPDFDSKVNSYLEPSEVRCLIDAVPHVSRYPVRDALLLEILWQSGTRVSEAVTMLPERVGQTSILFTNLKQYKRLKRDGKTIRISNPKAIKEVEVTEALCIAIKEWIKEQKIEPGQWVFPGRFKGHHLSRMYVWSLMNKAGDYAQISRRGKAHPRTGARYKSPSPHALRHSCAMFLLDSTGNLSVVGQQLGHSDPKSTQIYAWLKPARIKRLIREMDWEQRKEKE